LLLLIFAGILLSGFGVPPGWALGLGVVAVVGVWVYEISKAVEHARQIENLRLAAVHPRQEADETQAVADRLDAEAARMETHSALMRFVSPN
jgi:hypothetical protein